MNRILSNRKQLIIIIPFFLLLAITGFILCLWYSKRDWNATQFDTFYALWDFYVAYLVEAIGTTLLFIAFIFCSKKSNNKIRNFFSNLFLSLLCAGCLAVIITLIANCIGLNNVIKNYNLDCQLESEDQALFNEAIDALIAEHALVSYNFEEPNEFILKAARKGYPKAQNAMGYFYHERAKISLQKAESETHDLTHQNLIIKSEDDFDHAIYWFLKAAQNKFGVAQTNLGRIFMGDLASNRVTDYKLAKQWLLKAIQNEDVDAYYYLGIIYSTENLRDAYVYWSKGAELGNEDCARELEKPEFAMGIPVDRVITEEITPSDSVTSN